MKYAKDFNGKNDTEMIQNAIANREADGVVVISAYDNKTEWLLDSAVLLPSNTTVIIDNCKIKLSDRCRDNFFRTDNKVLDNGELDAIENIHIIGKGKALLEGADHPRATGCATKTLENYAPCTIEELVQCASWISEDHKKSGKLTYDDIHSHTYGTDAGKEGECQHGDDRNYGIYFLNSDNFSIENIHLKDTHGFAITVKNASNGIISHIHLDNHVCKLIDGKLQTMENQDGIDILQGSHDILVSDISGISGDDVVALNCNSVKESVENACDAPCKADIHDIIVRNIHATSKIAWIVRLLPVEASIYNVIVDNIIDTAKEPQSAGGVVVGFADSSYGRNLKDSNRNICISNVISNGTQGAVVVHGYMTDSVISNVICKNKEVSPYKITRDNGTKRVQINNVI